MPAIHRSWEKEFRGAITICDRKGIIVAMNEAAARVFEKDGGAKLIGANILDCHPEPSRTKLRGIMAEQKTNVYTIEKSGVKKLIYQSPWYKDGRYAGLVELALEIPFDLPHFIRD